VSPEPAPKSPAATARSVVWITGAAGGLAAGLVEAFAAQGWHVAATYHRRSPPPETDHIWPLPVDVTHREQVQSALDKILERWGRLDVLVNNAGMVADHLSWQLSESEWDIVLAVNLKGAFLCAQAALGPMRQQRDGHIINVASFAARHGPRGQANYAAAKAGLLGFTASLAKEVGSYNVRVNAILPGVLPTPMTARLKPAPLQDLRAANALGRLNSIAEVARFVVFLATMQNVSGQIFALDSRISRWS
jgi:NAD(P)-dependent dehydrogenase (short-subunit alcohol dehydrogenase family)